MNLPKPGIEPRSPVLQADSLPAEPQQLPNASAKVIPYLTSMSWLPGSQIRADKMAFSHGLFQKDDTLIPVLSQQSHQGYITFIFNFYFFLSNNPPGLERGWTFVYFCRTLLVRLANLTLQCLLKSRV